MKDGLSTSLKAGNSNLEGIIILVILLAIMIITPKGTPNSGTNPSQRNISNFSGEKTMVPSSSYAQVISLGTGNASYTYQPYEEYITIINRSRSPVDITNWQLKNNKDERAYDFGGTMRYFRADTATIPQATLFISPRGFNTFQNVVLQSGETAIVTTGKIGSQSPFRIVSFKENICSGYLEDLEEYIFTPPLTRNCPRPANEPGVSGLDTECRKFVERMATCHLPEFDTRDKAGEICSNCVDGKPLSSSCVAFIKNHFNYNSCIANHSSDQNFSGKTWRIFLGMGWEMWAEDYETIELFDQLGRLVNSRDY